MKDFLLCVDSDGCAIDGMTIKHLRCFGPCYVSVFKMEEHADELLTEWNRWNLYSTTRGKNRFLGLLAILEYANGKGYANVDVSALKSWIDTTAELSNKSLDAQMTVVSDPTLTLAKEWSLAVNASVAALRLDEKKAFDGVGDCFAQAKKDWDIAVVSSANAKAVEDEWSANGIYEYCDEVMTQEHGSKYDCIMRMLNMGYAADKVLMVGDAPGDKAAAEKAGVLFYPIIPTKEVECWKRLRTSVLAAVTDGSYKDTLMEQYTDEYFAVLASLS